MHQTMNSCRTDTQNDEKLTETHADSKVSNSINFHTEPSEILSKKAIFRMKQKSKPKEVKIEKNSGDSTPYSPSNELDNVYKMLQREEDEFRRENRYVFMKPFGKNFHKR